MQDLVITAFIYDYFFILVTSIYDFGWAFGPAKFIYISYYEVLYMKCLKITLVAMCQSTDSSPSSA